MSDESGRIRPISVPKVWPGHRDYTEQERSRVRLFGNQLRWATRVVQRALAERREDDEEELHAGQG